MARTQHGINVKRFILMARTQHGINVKRFILMARTQHGINCVPLNTCFNNFNLKAMPYCGSTLKSKFYFTKCTNNFKDG